MANDGATPSPDPLDDVLASIRADAERDALESLTDYISRAPEHQDAIASVYLGVKRSRIGSADEQRIAHFRLVRELGRGGQAVVWLAHDEDLNRPVALKLIQGLGPDAPKILERFRREAEITSKLDHPGICPVYGVGLDDVPWIAMRHVEGEPLSTWIDAARTAKDEDPTSLDFVSLENVPAETEAEAHEGDASSGSGPSTAREMSATLLLIEKAARALHAAHESGVIHRDVKPGNIMVGEDGEPVILDFGLAKDEDDGGPSLTMTGDMMGTPAYMSPEQLTRQTLRLDRRTDVWSLGVTLFECLTVQRPFQRPTREGLYNAILTEAPPDPRKLNPAIGRDLRVVIETALAKNRDDRYQTALELAEELRRIREVRPITAKPPSAWIRAVRWAQRNPALATAVVLLFLAISTAASILFVKNREVTESLENERTATKEKDAALSDFDRMADVKRLQEAEAEAAKLWPARPGKVPALRSWLDRYASLAGELEAHRASARRLESAARRYSPEEHQADHGDALAAITEKEARLVAIAKALDEDPPDAEAEKLEDEEEALTAEVASLRKQTEVRKTWRFAGADADLVSWKHGVLLELIGKLERFAAGDGTLQSVRSRLERAGEIEKLTVDDHRPAWDAAIARIAKHGKYGFALTPQVGLIPLGPDRGSTLEEFLHLDTHAGPIPERDANGTIEVTGETGVILVLIPSGRFWMGCQKDDPDGRNHDPEARSDEPLREVSIARPFLLSKYEMTQGQWSRMPVPVPRPTHYGPGWNHARQKEAVDDRNPVEQISWNDCRDLLPRAGLGLPSEEQWEYAARAGTATIWPGTSELTEIPRHGNIAGSEVVGLSSWPHESAFSDEWLIHAPVGRFRANGFGLHDVLGNVREWTSSLYSGPRLRVSRGGSFVNGAGSARVALRGWHDPSFRNVTLGVRPSRIITE